MAETPAVRYELYDRATDAVVGGDSVPPTPNTRRRWFDGMVMKVDFERFGIRYFDADGTEVSP